MCFNRFRVVSASNGIRSAYAQLILNDRYEIGSLNMCKKNFFGWLSISENHFGAPKVYLLPPCHPFLCPLLLSMYYVLCPLSLFLVSRPRSPFLPLCSLSSVHCPLSHVPVPCLPSAVPSLTSQLHVSSPLSPVSPFCSLSPVLCTLSPILLSP